MHLDLAAQMHQKVRSDTCTTRCRNRPHRVHDSLAVIGIGGGHRDIPQGDRFGHPHQVDCADIPMGLGDGCRDAREGAGTEGSRSDREAVGGRGTRRRPWAAKPISRASDTLSFPMATVKQKAPKDINLDDEPARRCDVFLVDGNGLTYRAFYACRKSSRRWRAAHQRALGTANMFMKLLIDYRPRRCWWPGTSVPPPAPRSRPSTIASQADAGAAEAPAALLRADRERLRIPQHPRQGWRPTT